MNDKKQKIQEAQIKRSTEKFAKSLQKKKASKPFSHLIWFSAFKASSVINQKGLPADYQYYKNKDYFIDCKLSTFEKIAIKIFARFFLFMMEKGLV